MDLSGVTEPTTSVPAPAVQRTFSRKRTLPIPDSDETSNIGTGTSISLRSSPRKRSKADTSQKVPEDSTTQRNLPVKGKGKGKEIAIIEDETPNEAGNIKYSKPSTSNSASKKEVLDEHDDDDVSEETAVESDGPKGTRKSSKKSKRKGNGNMSKKPRSRKKPDSGAGSSRGRSNFPAPDLDTVYEEIPSRENDQGNSLAQIQDESMSLTVSET